MKAKNLVKKLQKAIIDNPNIQVCICSKLGYPVDIGIIEKQAYVSSVSGKRKFLVLK